MGEIAGIFSRTIARCFQLLAPAVFAVRRVTKLSIGTRPSLNVRLTIVSLVSFEFGFELHRGMGEITNGLGTRSLRSQFVAPPFPFDRVLVGSFVSVTTKTSVGTGFFSQQVRA